MLADSQDDELERHVGVLFEQHRGAVFAYLARLLRDLQLAEELTQETFFRVFRSRERLPGVENERAWIFRIATNVCRSEVRRRRRWRWLPWEMAGDPASGHDDFAVEVGRRDAVEQALARLEETYRAPLLLFSYYGFNITEIATILQISEGAVKTRVYRAKRMFLREHGLGESK